MRVFIRIFTATKHINNLYTMKLNKIFILALASVFAVTACQEKEDLDSQEASIVLESEKKIELSKDAQEFDITFKSNRDWEASTNASWISVPKSGEADAKSQTINVSVLSNDSYQRTGVVTISIGTQSCKVTIVQNGNGAAAPDGTKENPFTPELAVAKAQEVGETNSAETYYTKGIISVIKEIGTSFGNATYSITIDGSTESVKLDVYRGKGLGNETIANADYLKVGDEVIVCGNLVNYKGNTPQYAQGNYIYSLNGEIKGSSGDNFGEPKGDGTEANPFNPSAANAKALENSFDPTKEKDQINALPEWYVKGVVSTVKSIDTGTYGNAELFISEDGTKEAGEFLLYRIYYINGEKFTSADQVKVGDEIVVKGRLFNAFGNTPEMNQGGQIISVNGGTEVGPYLGISVKAKQVTAEAGSFTFNVKANQAWTVAAEGFVSVAPASGEGDAEVTVTYTANDGERRTAAVTVKAADGKEAVLTVTQLGANEEPAGEITWTKDEWVGSGNTYTLTKDGYTVTIDKQNGSTAPALRDDNSVRLYAKGTLKIESAKPMTSITIILASDAGYRYTTVTADSGEVGAQAVGDTQVSWTGNATSVTFTVGDSATLGSDGAAKAGQLRFSGFAIQ